jgi:hypothetical protein
MVTLEKITPSMFSDIYRSFLANDDPHSSEEDWRRLFFYPWAEDNDYYGHALVDSGSVVGVLGMVFSRRQWEGQAVRFCNLHTWHVKEEYRGRSLMLMRPALALKDHILTDFTATERVGEISKRLGFEQLDSTPRLLLPAVFRGRRGNVDAVDDPEELAGRLSAADVRIFHDHQEQPCQHLAFVDGKQTCYVVYSRVERHWLPYCYIHYVSNREMFGRHSLCIRKELMQRAAARYVAIDARQASGMRLPLSLRCPVRSHQLVRGSGWKPSQIDTLYSEVSILNLCTFPSLGHQLRRLTGRFGLGRGSEREVSSASCCKSGPKTAWYKRLLSLAGLRRGGDLGG